jgi:dimethylamine monooxygenase subunit A
MAYKTAVVLQNSVPHYPWMQEKTARLPGIQPLIHNDFLRVDEAFGGQMALRDGLIAQNLSAVYAQLPQAGDAATELLDVVLEYLSGQAGYRIGQTEVLRPDGVNVELDRSKPLLTCGRLVQEDLCILQSDGREHVLTGAILCFPASWTLVQKIGRPMSAIHIPVDSYTPEMAARVQRMFDAIRPEQGLWRMNWLTYADPVLHQPRLENTPRSRASEVEKPYLRCERQCLIRLPKTRAVVFTIHSYVMPIALLPAPEREALLAASH